VRLSHADGQQNQIQYTQAVLYGRGCAGVADSYGIESFRRCLILKFKAIRSASDGLLIKQIRYLCFYNIVDIPRMD